MDKFVNPMICPECGERQEDINVYDFIPYGRMFQECNTCWNRND